MTIERAKEIGDSLGIPWEDVYTQPKEENGAIILLGTIILCLIVIYIVSKLQE